MTTAELYLVIFGTIGWLMTLYFGFFRYRHYAWAKKKVQFDLFTRVNQSNNNLFLKTTTLLSVKDKNNKTQAKSSGVLTKYFDHIVEKVFLIRAKVVDQKIAAHWIAGIRTDMDYLQRQDESVVQELLTILGDRPNLQAEKDIYTELIAPAQRMSAEDITAIYESIINRS